MSIKRDSFLDETLDISSVNYYAKRILFLINTGTRSIDKLTEKQTAILMLYFYINNPVVNRMVKLKYK